MSSQACATPLYELLRAVPKHERLTIDNGYSTHCIPVGRHCHDAADILEKLHAQQIERNMAEAKPVEAQGVDREELALGVLGLPCWKRPDGTYRYVTNDEIDAINNALRTPAPAMGEEPVVLRIIEESGQDYAVIHVDALSRLRQPVTPDAEVAELIWRLKQARAVPDLRLDLVYQDGASDSLEVLLDDVIAALHHPKPSEKE